LFHEEFYRDIPDSIKNFGVSFANILISHRRLEPDHCFHPSADGDERYEDKFPE